MQDMILLILKVCLVSLLMKYITNFCIFRAKATRNKNIRFIWFLIAILFVIAAILIASILLWNYIISILN